MFLLKTTKNTAAQVLVKKFRAFDEEFRNRLKNYNTMTDIVWWLISVYRNSGSLKIKQITFQPPSKTPKIIGTEVY